MLNRWVSCFSRKTYLQSVAGLWWVSISSMRGIGQPVSGVGGSNLLIRSGMLGANNFDGKFVICCRDGY